MHPILNTAVRAAEAAARVHRRGAGSTGATDGVDKGHQDWVSAVDLDAQEAAVEVIRSRHPDHRVLAEEEGEGHDARDARGPLWIVDPLDGTTNFLHGHPEFCASVGFWHDGEPEAACVVSSRGERYTALRGRGAWKGGRPIRVSATDRLERALIGTGFPFKRLDLLESYLEQLGRVLPRTSGVRRQGSAALDLCYLAEGRIDGFWELVLAPWDIAAGLLVVTEAGGVVTRLGGAVPDLESGSVLAANSQRLHEALGELVRD